MADIDGESVTMTLWGAPTRPPILMIESDEPLATGLCSTATKYHAGNFELFVIPISE